MKEIKNKRMQLSKNDSTCSVDALKRVVPVLPTDRQNIHIHVNLLQNSTRNQPSEASAVVHKNKLKTRYRQLQDELNNLKF